MCWLEYWEGSDDALSLRAGRREVVRLWDLPPGLKGTERMRTMAWFTMEMFRRYLRIVLGIVAVLKTEFPEAAAYIPDLLVALLGAAVTAVEGVRIAGYGEPKVAK